MFKRKIILSLALCAITVLATDLTINSANAAKNTQPLGITSCNVNLNGWRELRWTNVPEGFTQTVVDVLVSYGLDVDHYPGGNDGFCLWNAS
ncbi:MAG: hypothetical protein AB7L92_03480 [Alphaproteobacteria bacterium]